MRARVLTIVLSAALLASCAGDSEPSIEQARQALIEETRSRLDAASWYRWFETLPEALPNVTYRRPNHAPTPVAEVVVLGEIVEVTEGVGFWPAGSPDAAEQIREVAFDDDRALWRTFHLRIRVDRSVGTEVGEEVIVTWPIDGQAHSTTDFDVEARALRGLGPVLALLQRNATSDYATHLWAVVEAGALLGTVSEDGTLAFPFMEKEREQRFLGNLRTVDDVWREAGKPSQVRDVPA